MPLTRRQTLEALRGVGALGLSACASSSGAPRGRYNRQQLEASLAGGEQAFPPGLHMGSFVLADHAVVDGDTLKVGGLDQSLRLLGLDTEETFKSEKSRRAYEQGWAAYLAQAQRETSRPVKIPTPLGEAAKDYALEFFRGITRVELERDHPKEVRGRYSRFLTYAFAERDGKRIHYNVECVRAGMSPYFTKYGYSRNYHDDFLAAQAEAQAAKRGIWEPGTEHYPDYPLRLRWWNARADFLAAYEAEAEADPAKLVLTHWDSPQRLADAADREIEIIGGVGDIRRPEPGKKGPIKVMLGRRMGDDFPLIFWDEEVLAASGIEKFKGEFIRARGVVAIWHNPYRQEDQSQLVIELPGQIQLPSYTPPGTEVVAAPPPMPEPT